MLIREYKASDWNEWLRMAIALFPVEWTDDDVAEMHAAESWARDQGYREMGSNALLDNHVSHMAHERSGYAEVDRVVTYRKGLR